MKLNPIRINTPATTRSPVRTMLDDIVPSISRSGRGFPLVGTAVVNEHCGVVADGNLRDREFGGMPLVAVTVNHSYIFDSDATKF